MDYNTSRNKLILPEYGRNIQKMIEHAKTIENDEERNRAAKAIITVMGNMNPHLRDINDFKHKLWDHLAIMSNFDLNIESPYPLPTIEKLTERPEVIPYKDKELKYRHYGRVVEMLIDKITTLESDVQQSLLKVLGGHMKRSYYLWHNENTSEESVLEIIKELSNNRIDIPDNFHFDDGKDNRSRKRR